MAASTNSTTDPWLSNQKITSAEGRLALGATWAKSPTSSILAEAGMIEGANPTASVSGNNVTTTAHQCVVEAAGGTFTCTTTGSLVCAIDTPLPTSGQSRYDIIYAEVVDPGDAATYRLNTVKGTASASPTIPSAPANTVPVWRVQVTNAGPQTPVAIWPWTRAAGAARLVETGDTRVGGFTGDQRKFRTGQVDVWTGSAWVTTVAPIAWSQFAPALSFPGEGGGSAGTVNLGAGGQAIGRYLQAGKLLHLAYTFYFGTSGLDGGSGIISTVLPPGMTSRASIETHIPCYLFSGSGQPYNWAGMCYVAANANSLSPRFSNSQGDCRLNAFKVAAAPGAASTGCPNIPGAYPIATGSILSITGTIEIQ